jgi:hypothetical protein
VNSSRGDREVSGGSRGGDAPASRPGVAARHPIISAVMLGCTALGIVLGYLLLGEEWSVARRLLGGAVGGAGVGLLLTAPRMIG